MKLLFQSTLASILVGYSIAFSPACRNTQSFRTSQRTVRKMAEEKKNVPFFARTSSPPSSPSAGAVSAPAPETTSSSLTLEEEVEMMVQKEVAKVQRASKLGNAQGLEYAPWMGISPEDEAQIRVIMRERAEARRKRKEQEKSVSGNLYTDSQAQELSGTGLKYKVIDSSSVELEWATKTETNTKGFIVKRRPAKTEFFETIASYASWSPLISKGATGGVYRYLDSDTTPGGWVYRISEVDNNGNESDLCQTLVEIQTPEEQKAGLIAGVSIAVLAVGAMIAGLALDPYAS